MQAGEGAAGRRRVRHGPERLVAQDGLLEVVSRGEAVAERGREQAEGERRRSGAKRLNPLSLWDLHWVKELDDAGFIDDLTSRLQS